MGADLEFGGAPDEEIVGGTVSYLDVLDHLHRELTPRRYLEIGVRHGSSLVLARGPAIGVDPAPDIRLELPTSTRIIARTSDDFFRAPEGHPYDLGFIDGMHLLEFALRDFINFERHANPGAVVAVDDIFPNHPAQAERRRRTRAWTGDVWRLVPILEAHRPDLHLLTIDASPAGLLLVAGLDPKSRTLERLYDSLVGDTRPDERPPASVIGRLSTGSRDPVSSAGPTSIPSSFP